MGTEFNSYFFILFFLPATIILYYLFGKYNKNKISNIVLLLANILFYATLSIRFLIPLFLIIITNYILGNKIRSSQKNKIKYLLIAITINILILISLKYTNFFIQSINQLPSFNFNEINIILPIGISFFSFSQISYLVDTYRNETKKTSLLNFFVFSSLFITIIQGPISYYNEIIPNINNVKNKKINYVNLSHGLYSFIMGLSKKVLIADTINTAVVEGYKNINEHNSSTLLLIIVLYSLQIYFDFSGYSDMAVGIGKMLNIDLVQNFNSPYKSFNMNEFWKRWHISLTRFLTKYIYFPLGGNRKGKYRTYINIMIVFFISGFWHGASYNFIIWGIIHGIGIVLTKVFKNKIDSLHSVIQWIIMFSFVNFAWIFFRSTSLEESFNFINGIIEMDFSGINNSILHSMNLVEYNYLFNILGLEEHANMIPYIYISLLLIGVITMKNTHEKIIENKFGIKRMIVSILLMVLSILSLTMESTFMYQGF